MCGFSASWLGCGRGFESHATRLRNGARLRAGMRAASAPPVTLRRAPLKGEELALSGLAVAQASGRPHETPASPRQTAFCKETQRRQGAEKLCSLACSAVIFHAKLLTKEIRNVFMHLSIQESGLLPFLG